MTKLRATHGDIASVYGFYCPGCKTTHGYTVYKATPERGWTFNGDFEKPTFSPSLLVYPGHQNPRCHLFLTDGELRYCSDSDHDHAGLTIPLPDIPDNAT